MRHSGSAQPCARQRAQIDQGGFASAAALTATVMTAACATEGMAVRVAAAIAVSAAAGPVMQPELRWRVSIPTRSAAPPTAWHRSDTSSASRSRSAFGTARAPSGPPRTSTASAPPAPIGARPGSPRHQVDRRIGPAPDPTASTRLHRRGRTRPASGIKAGPGGLPDLIVPGDGDGPGM
jgi:hypothetical protein